MAKRGDVGTSKAVPLFGIGNPSRSRFISSVERVNAVTEPSQGGRQERVIVGLPGFEAVTSFSKTPARAIFNKDGESVFYVATGGELLRVIEGDYTRVANLSSSSGPVWMDDNGTQLFVNDGIRPFIYTFTSGLVEYITDIDYPTGAIGGVYLEGRFWVVSIAGERAGRVYASDIRNGLAWDGLNFIEPSSKPDSIVGIVRHASDLVIVGSGSIEWWSSTPTAIPGALGFQPSASPNTEIGGVQGLPHATVGQSLFFVGQDAGGVSIYVMRGYAIERLDNPAFDDEIGRHALARAVCAGYSVLGHDIFQLTLQGAAVDTARTWIYDLASGEWNRRESYGYPYYRGLLAAGSIGALYLTDAFTGDLHRVDDREYSEAGAPLCFSIKSQHILKDGDHVTIHAIQIDMENGLGRAMPSGDDPHGILRVSKDGGRSWPIERHVQLGKSGDYHRRVRDTQFGVARDFAIEFSTDAPIPRRVSGAYLTIDPNYA